MALPWWLVAPATTLGFAAASTAAAASVAGGTLTCGGGGGGSGGGGASTSAAGAAVAAVLRLVTPSRRAIVGSRAHLHLAVTFCIAPHLERCTRHRDGSRRAPRKACLHLVVIF